MRHEPAKTTRLMIVAGLLTPAGIAALFTLYVLLSGQLYLRQLNWVDATTVLMAAALYSRGILKFGQESLFKAFGLSLVGAFSFIYAFEAVYKFVFLGWLKHDPCSKDTRIDIFRRKDKAG